MHYVEEHRLCARDWSGQRTVPLEVKEAWEEWSIDHPDEVQILLSLDQASSYDLNTMAFKILHLLSLVPPSQDGRWITREGIMRRVLSEHHATHDTPLREVAGMRLHLWSRENPGYMKQIRVLYTKHETARIAEEVRLRGQPNPPTGPGSPTDALL